MKEYSVFKLENIYVDTSLCRVNDLLDYISNFGSERIIFGSDWPYSTPAKEAIKILKLPIPKEFKRRIFFENSMRIIKWQ
jgi:predicted TIM-barrel fold metal-dependent hydrolase